METKELRRAEYRYSAENLRREEGYNYLEVW